jgi:hypothetical protein
MHKFAYIRAYGSSMYGPSSRSERVPVTVLAETQSEAVQKILAVAPPAAHGQRYYLYLQSIEEVEPVALPQAVRPEGSA